ncbi:translation initiation factor 1 [Clonorchis sinensis]|uniref:Translation initiation factor 1 n=1 Tax=Clonorchis sinensis TaxID=79923 RepID=G7YXB1_CLOSI|nr:translation initiation factor 1 [Clonorchis sinensis]
MSLQNLQTYGELRVPFVLFFFTDPFAEEGESTSEGKFVHIRIQQRNGRKTITTVQGLHEKYDKRKILKQCKKEFACNGTVVDHEEYGEVIQLQGDQREHMKKFLCTWKLATPEGIKLHGF